jgi:uncharacterized membrane protein
MLAISRGLYNLLKFIHVMAAIVWLGGSIFIQIYVTRLTRANETEQVTRFAGNLERMGKTVFMPSSITLLVIGIVMVIATPYLYFSEPWIIIGVLGIAATVITGTVFLGPESTRIATAVQEQGPGSAEVQERTKRIFTISRIDLVVLVLVVADMVFKPGSKGLA